MTLISDGTMELFRQYQDNARRQIAAGARPALLACETDGFPCSHKFAQVLQDDGLIPAVTDLLARCPKGAMHVPQALLYSVGFAILPQSFSAGGYRPSGREHKSPVDKALGCGV